MFIDNLCLFFIKNMIKRIFLYDTSFNQRSIFKKLLSGCFLRSKILEEWLIFLQIP